MLGFFSRPPAVLGLFFGIDRGLCTWTPICSSFFLDLLWVLVVFTIYGTEPPKGTTQMGVQVGNGVTHMMPAMGTLSRALSLGSGVFRVGFGVRAWGTKSHEDPT